MELNINSPAYFSDRYGVDDEVYEFCRKLYSFFKDKEYSDTLHTIGILPVVAPEESYESGAWKESVQIIGNKSCAIVTLRINFNEYYVADSYGKNMLIKDAVAKAAKKIKSKVNFNYESFLQALNQFSESYQF